MQTTPQLLRKMVSGYQKEMQRIALLEALAEAVKAMPSKPPEIEQVLTQLDKAA